MQKGKNILEDIERMMFAFGDDKDIDLESKEILQQYIYDFIDKIIRKSMQRSISRGIYN